MKNKGVQFTIILILLAIVAINATLDDSLTSVRIEKDLTRIDYDNPLKEIALKLLSGFRGLFAKIIWEKVHQYFHRYEFFERSGALVFNVKDPSKSTYQQTNILPWIRIATWLDPTFYEPYLVGAWHLANNLGNREDALDLLVEVEQKNPDDPKLKYEMANNFLSMHEYQKALTYAQIALKSNKLDLFERLDTYRVIKLAYQSLGKEEKAAEIESKMRDFVQANKAEFQKMMSEEN